MPRYEKARLTGEFVQGSDEIWWWCTALFGFYAGQWGSAQALEIFKI